MDVGIVGVIDQQLSCLYEYISCAQGISEKGVSSLLIKGMAVNVLLQYMLRPVLRGRIWFDCLYVISVFISVLLVYGIYYFRFEGSLFKIGLFGMLAEANFYALFLTPMMLVNYLEERSSLFVYDAVFLLQDLLLYPIIGILLFVECRCFQGISNRVKVWEPKYRKLSWTVLVVYLFFAFVSMMEGIADISWRVTAPLIIGTGAATAIIVFVAREQGRVRQIRKFTAKQQQLIKLHYMAIMDQESLLKKDISLVETQIQELERFDQVAGGKKRIKSYFLTLEEEYEKLKAGSYCDGWLTDAVLFCMGQICRSQGIGFQTSFHIYHGNAAQDEYISALLLVILDWEIHEYSKKNHDGYRRILLEAGTVKGQVIFHFSFDGLTQVKRLKRKVHSVSEKQPVIRSVNKKDGCELLVMLK